MGVQLGKFRKIFFNASAPSGAFDSGDYTQVLQVTSIGMAGTRAQHGLSPMDAVFEPARLAGPRRLPPRDGAGGAGGLRVPAG